MRREQLIHRRDQLGQITDAVDGVGVREISRHITITGAPLAGMFRVEPDDSFAAPLDLIHQIETRVVVIVARITHENNRGAMVDGSSGSSCSVAARRVTGAISL